MNIFKKVLVALTAVSWIFASPEGHEIEVGPNEIPVRFEGKVVGVWNPLYGGIRQYVPEDELNPAGGSHNLWESEPPVILDKIVYRPSIANEWATVEEVLRGNPHRVYRTELKSIDFKYPTWEELIRSLSERPRIGENVIFAGGLDKMICLKSGQDHVSLEAFLADIVPVQTDACAEQLFIESTASYRRIGTKQYSTVAEILAGPDDVEYNHGYLVKQCLPYIKFTKDHDGGYILVKQSGTLKIRPANEAYFLNVRLMSGTEFHVRSSIKLPWTEIELWEIARLPARDTYPIRIYDVFEILETDPEAGEAIEELKTQYPWSAKLISTGDPSRLDLVLLQE